VNHAEPAIAAALAWVQSPDRINRMSANIAKEEDARQIRDAALLIRLMGEFHLLMAPGPALR
jgi:DNA-binding GntR family transcriptional regulator